MLGYIVEPGLLAVIDGSVKIEIDGRIVVLVVGDCDARPRARRSYRRAVICFLLVADPRLYWLLRLMVHLEWLMP